MEKKQEEEVLAKEPGSQDITRQFAEREEGVKGMANI